MATDATGTPTTNFAFPTYNVGVDRPTGVGLNNIIADIDSKVVGKPASIASGEVPVWNGSAWVRSSVTRIGASSLGSGSASSSTFLRGDGTWAAVDLSTKLSVVSTDVASIDVTNTTTPTLIYNKTIPGGTMGANGMIAVDLFGDCIYNSASANFTCKVKWGGTTILDDTFSQAAVNADRRPWMGRLHVFNLGATNSQRVYFEANANKIEVSNNSTTGMIGGGIVNNAAPWFITMASNAPHAVDTTSDQTLQVEITWGTAATTLSWAIRCAKTVVYP